MAARISAPVHTAPGSHTASCTMGTGSFRGVKSGRGVTLTHHPLLVPCSVQAVRSLECLSVCTLVLYLYYPYGPYGLYRAPVPVQCSYTSTTPMDRTASTEPQCLYSTGIPLLPLWTVRPVQSLSACTVQLNLYIHYGPYGLYRAPVPVQYSYTSTTTMARTACREPQCLYSTTIPLLPLWAVRSVQSLSACIVQLYL